MTVLTGRVTVGALPVAAAAPADGVMPPPSGVKAAARVMKRLVGPSVALVEVAAMGEGVPDVAINMYSDVPDPAEAPGYSQAVVPCVNPVPAAVISSPPSLKITAVIRHGRESGVNVPLVIASVPPPGASWSFPFTTWNELAVTPPSSCAQIPGYDFALAHVAVTESAVL